MKPKPRPEASQLNLFQAQFDQLLNLEHPLCVLARKIDWQRFDIAFADCYCPDIGAPGKDIRLLVGLHYLKHTFNESDESLLERWVENPYWQYFCGFETMQHELPLHSTSLTKWRQRVGADRLVMLLEPKIGHLKSDNRMSRCFLKGLIGDEINALLAAAGSNLQKLLRAIARALFFWLWSVLDGPIQPKFAFTRRRTAAA